MRRARFEESDMCDVYAVIEASKLLEKLATDDLPGPVRRMLIHAQQKLDEDIETYFKPRYVKDRCSPELERRERTSGNGSDVRP